MKSLCSIKPIILDRSDLFKDSKHRSISAINISDFNIKEELFWESPLVIFMDGDPNSLIYDRPMRVLKDRHGIFGSKENLTAAWKSDEA